MSKSKEYTIERRKKPGTYSEDLENEFSILFEWGEHPLKGCGGRYTTEASASVAISELTASWAGWEFRVTPVLDG
tara:strand:+ start:332 stop:556 length:225 start_codon:yes stop_codon:yes gene_type:complete